MNTYFFFLTSNMVNINKPSKQKVLGSSATIILEVPWGPETKKFENTHA